MSIESLKTDSVRPASLLARADGRGVNLVFLGALAASFFVAYLPTYLRLAGGAWQTEQEGHGPLIMLAAAWLAWQQRDKLKAIAAKQLNVLPDDVELAQGKIRSRSNPDNALPFGRVAATSHWSPAMLPENMAPALSETGIWSPPELEPPTSDDRINTSLTYGFVFDMCGVEIDPKTYQVRVDRYVSMHDAGRILNPTIAEGQIRGAFAQGIAAALYEEFTYNDEGAFLSGTFADYLVPTVSEIPDVEILHYSSPSPFTPLGAKGLAEGNCMSTPACIANAIADALGIEDVTLPATPRRIHAILSGGKQ